MFFESCIFDGLLHGNIIKRRTITHEAFELAINILFQIDTNRPMDMGAKTKIGVFLAEIDTTIGIFQGCEYFGLIVSDTRYNTKTCYHNTTHSYLFDLQNFRI